MNVYDLTCRDEKGAICTRLWLPEGDIASGEAAEILCAGWAALAPICATAATADDVEPYRNAACPGSIPLIILPEGGHLTREAAECVALWDSEVIAFAAGCGPDAPGEETNARLLLARGKRLLREVESGHVLDAGFLISVGGLTEKGDLWIATTLPGTRGRVVPCQVAAIRGVGGPWFDVQEVGPQVYALAEQGHAERAISYLILGSERAALVDTGMGIADIRHAVRKLTDKPVLVINTHSHYDHVGDNHRFDEIALFPTPLSLAVAERGWTHDEIKATGALSDEAFFRPASLPQSFDPAAHRIPPFRLTRPLQDGEVFDLGGRKLEIWHTPGHSGDSVCLLDARHRLLFTGDTFYPGTLYCHFGDADLEAYARTAARLAAIAPQLARIYPAHNQAGMAPDVLAEFAAALEAVCQGRAPYRLLEADALCKSAFMRFYRWPRFNLALTEQTG